MVASSTCVIRKFEYLQNKGTFFLELCPRLSTLKFQPRQVDGVVNKNSSTVEFVDDTYDGRRTVTVYYTSVNR